MAQPLRVTATRIEGENLVLTYDYPAEHAVDGHTGIGHEHWMPLEEIVQHRAALYDLAVSLDVIHEVIWERLAEKMHGVFDRIPHNEERRAAAAAYPVIGLKQALTAAGITLPLVDAAMKTAWEPHLNAMYGERLGPIRGKAHVPVQPEHPPVGEPEARQ